MSEGAGVPSAGEAPADGARPTTALPISHLARISLYWLGLTAIDGAVGLFTQNRLNFGGFADPLEIGRIAFLISIPKPRSSPSAKGPKNSSCRCVRACGRTPRP